MSLDVNTTTIALHLCLYVGVLLIMKFLYVDPVLKLLRKREALTEGRKSTGEEKKQKLLSMKQEYEVRVNEVKMGLEEKRQDMLRRVHGEIDDKISKLRKDLEAKMAKYQLSLTENISQLQKQTSLLGDGLGREIAECIMTAKVVKL